MGKIVHEEELYMSLCVVYGNVHKQHRYLLGTKIQILLRLPFLLSGCSMFWLWRTEWIFMFPAMFSFEIWKIVAKINKVERWWLSWKLQVSYLIAKWGGMSVSVLKMYEVSTPHCSMVFDDIVLMPLNGTILLLDPQNKRAHTHIALPWVFILADLFKPAFRHVAKNVELHHEHQWVTWGLHFHILWDSGKTDSECYCRPYPNPVQDFVWHLLVLINW